uniref:Uncharacterized protein n=1 Tax=Arundo donax TaxID=35708 RepID=A0A0A9FQU9_ARUDO
MANNAFFTLKLDAIKCFRVMQWMDFPNDCRLRFPHADKTLTKVILSGFMAKEECMN